MPTITPVSADKFANRRWVRFKDYSFASRDIFSPITSQEAIRALLGLPLGFIRSNGTYNLVALQGLETDVNLFVDAGQKWRGLYIPHRYSCYPFYLIENKNGESILCVDEDSNLIIQDGPDTNEAFFGEDKKPTPLVTEILNFLSTHNTQMKSTKINCAQLHEHRLIKPWPLKLETLKGEIQLEEFYCIDEERLNSLTASSLKEIRNSNALAVAYAQLFSMFNIKLLVQALNEDTSANKQAPRQLPSEINFSTLNTDALLNFDNL